MAAEPHTRIQRRAVARVPLPTPDRLELAFPVGRVCLVAGDGGSLTAAVLTRLGALGWPMVLMRLPVAADSVAQAAGSVACVTLADLNEGTLEAALAEARSRWGAAGAFIYVHPDGHGAAPLCSSPRDKALVRAAFLMAKHLHADLTSVEADGRQRAAFLVVTRLDGQLGLSGCYAQSVVAGGFPGLTKTLGLEWPAVFCRTLDLDPDLDSGTAASFVAEELLDPNLLVAEVGRSLASRMTIAVDTVGF